MRLGRCTLSNVLSINKHYFQFILILKYNQIQYLWFPKIMRIKMNFWPSVVAKKFCSMDPTLTFRGQKTWKRWSEANKNEAESSFSPSVNNDKEFYSTSESRHSINGHYVTLKQWVKGNYRLLLLKTEGFFQCDHIG